MSKAGTLIWVGMSIFPPPRTLSLPRRRARPWVSWPDQALWGWAGLHESRFVLQRFTRAGIYSEHLKQAIDLKMKLELALKKCEELNIKPERELRNRVSSWS